MSTSIDEYVENMSEDFALKTFYTINNEALSTPINLVKALGSIELAVISSYIVHLFKSNKCRKFYKTDSSFREYFSLSEKQWKTLKNKMKRLDFLEISVQGIPAKTTYCVDLVKYDGHIKGN